MMAAGQAGRPRRGCRERERAGVHRGQATAFLHWGLGVLGCTFVLLSPGPAPGTPHTDKAMWDLTDLYPSTADWRERYDEVKTEAEELDGYKATLGQSPAQMLRALDAIAAVNKAANRLYAYASLKADEDLTDARNQERKQQAGALTTLISEKTAWLAPEILSIGAETVKKFESEAPLLAARHDFFLDNVLRAAPHTLGLEAESVLASAGDVLQQPDTIYGQLANSDLPFPKVRLSDGTEVVLDQPAYEKYRQSENRADRKLVFDAFWGAWKKYESTDGAILTAQIMGDVFTAKARHYPNALAAALFPDNMPEAVYRTLVEQANAGLPTLYRYFRLRKQLLGIKGELEYYDIYPTMFPGDAERHFTLDESKRIVAAALQPYGAEYGAMLSKGFAGKWMDPYPRPHKSAGAYMNGSAYDVHPYVLLNYNDDYEGLATFAHEWGHAVHTMLTVKNQPYEKSHYSTFIAESASIANEMLLNDYMVAHAKTRAEQLYYLGEGLESIRGTFFRQVMFAEFELALHEEIEAGRPLSGARMTQIYCDLLRRYYGEAQGVMHIDPAYCIEWAFVPHFYYNFYVYQYATSMAGAAEFTDAIVKEKNPAAERFLAMLRAGGSDYPYDLYRRAGIDMATSAPYRALIARMNRIMDEIETIEGTR
jgi:oligoendopeptidase F